MQVEIWLDKMVRARYLSSKATSVSASRRTSRGFPPGLVVKVDSSV
jgi:hypothetical protein